jgi:putative colanic acid biosynthesis glycosyltransferase
LRKTVDSIIIQNFRDFEVWIIDGNSSNETQEYLSKLEAPFFYQSKTDKGIYDAMNKGISLSKGEWFYFLGAGDLLEDENILNVVSKKLNINLDILYGNIRYDTTKFKSKFSGLLWIKNTLHHQSVFYNKKLFTQINYEISYKVLADYDFNLTLYCKNINAEKIDAIIANCDKEGISKDYNWSLYREEIKLKSTCTNSVFYPLFFLLVAFKFFLRRYRIGFL